MSIAAQAKPLDLSHEMRSFIGRHTDKSFDWDAFPGSRGFPELERAQMRYIGAGGSPKADDPTTLRPGRFTLSLVHQPVGKYAACHSHEVVEHFLVLEGVLTVGWAWGDEVIEARLGPKDMVLNKAGRAHGFRNDGVEPVLMSISVGSGMPKPPVYVCHPREADAAIARHFGASPKPGCSGHDVGCTGIQCIPDSLIVVYEFDQRINASVGRIRFLYRLNRNVVLSGNLAHFTKEIADNLVADRDDTNPVTLTDQLDDHSRTGKCLTGSRWPLDRHHGRFVRKMTHHFFCNWNQVTLLIRHGF